MPRVYKVVLGHWGTSAVPVECDRQPEPETPKPHSYPPLWGIWSQEKRLFVSRGSRDPIYNEKSNADRELARYKNHPVYAGCYVRLVPMGTG